jgi:hypothetical protein
MAETKPPLNNGAVTMQYRYDHLPERAIRLLDIPEKSIEQPWSLNVYDLDRCSPYVCLSYTWGPPLNTEECEAEYEGAKRSLVLQSGNHTGRLEVGLNLWEGLEQLIAAGCTGLLWVDAICINQDDPQERSSQVAIMGQIYGDSEGVIVWLGKDQSNLEDFSWFHDTLLPALEKHFDDGGGFSDLMQLIQGANLGVEPSARWRGYILFYEQHRWFHRCWIVQEIACAPKITVFCGNASIDFQDFCDMASFLNDLATAIVPAGWRPGAIHTELTNGHKGHGIVLQRTACQLTELRRLFGMFPITGAKTPSQMCFSFFFSSLSVVRRYEASNPRDKVYAAIGMATKFLPSGETIIVPDYSSSVVDVYARTTAFLIEKLPYLAVLSFVEDGGVRILSDLPSWVPDFSSNFVRSPYSSRYEDYPHNACALEDVGIHPRSIVGSTLQLYGGYFETVEVVVGEMRNYRIETDRSMAERTLYTLDVCYRLLEFLSSLAPFYLNGTSRLEALSRTLILDQVDKKPPPSEASVMFHDWLLDLLALYSRVSRIVDEAHEPFKACMQCLQNLQENEDKILPSEDFVLLHARLSFTTDYEILERAPRDAAPDEGPAESEEEDPDEADTNHQMYYRGLSRGLFLQQRLYKTSRGYIGLGPPSMRPGDEVWFICDATVPFVLRREPGARCYSMIAETYLHGLMNGEVLKTDYKDRIGPLYLE